jgi:hypothetical protein
LRGAGEKALRISYETGKGISVASHQLDVFLFAPGSDAYLGRLCSYNACPKGKPDCFVPGCGAIPFNQQFSAFSPRSDLLAGAEAAMLYRRGVGRLRSALDLPVPGQEP